MVVIHFHYSDGIWSSCCLSHMFVEYLDRALVRIQDDDIGTLYMIRVYRECIQLSHMLNVFDHHT